MNFLNAKSTLALTAALLAAPALAQNVLTNGDMSYGDGGWYLWNNPDGPAKVDLQLGQPGLGVDGSEGVKVTVKELPNPSWGLQLQHNDNTDDTVRQSVSLLLPLNAENLLFPVTVFLPEKVCCGEHPDFLSCHIIQHGIQKVIDSPLRLIAFLLLLIVLSLKIIADKIIQCRKGYNHQ